MSDEPNAWDRMPNEANLWYARFCRFLEMGATRSLLGCANRERTEKGKKRQTSPPTSWRVACQVWRWRERAEAFDQAQRDKALAEVERAAVILRQAATQAADALRGQLTAVDGRIVVQAAKEILSRAGLPEISRVQLAPLRAEDLSDEELAAIAAGGRAGAAGQAEGPA